MRWASIKPSHSRLELKVRLTKIIGPFSSLNKMADLDHTSSIKPTLVVSEGIGKTANITGAKAKEVHNVSMPNC